MRFSRRVQVFCGLGLMVALFATMVGVNARLSWRPVTVDFGVGASATPSALAIGWYDREIWFLSQLSGVGTTLEEADTDIPQLSLVRPARNWNRASLPLRFVKSLQNTSEGVGTLCVAHKLFACTSGDGEIEIWRDKKLERTVREKWRPRTPVGTSPGQPDVLCFSPNGKFLVSSSELEDGEGPGEDKTDFCIYGLALFDVANGRQVVRQSAFEGAFSDVAWSPDSSEFAGITQDGWVFVFGKEWNTAVEVSRSSTIWEADCLGARWQDVGDRH